jgi:hypothetical protein
MANAEISCRAIFLFSLAHSTPPTSRKLRAILSQQLFCATSFWTKVGDFSAVG